MLVLILKLEEPKINYSEKQIVETTGQEINGLLAALRKSVILDAEGDPWVIDDSEDLYFEAYPPHFEIACKPQDDEESRQR